MNATRTAPTDFRYPRRLLFAYVLLWCALAVRPWYRQDWLLENLLPLISVPMLVATARRLRFSDAAYTCLFAFFALHAIGAHYTYSEVPYERWLASAGLPSLNAAFDWQRNQYDRLVHFAYGLLVTPAAVHLLRSVAPARGIWRLLLPLLFMISHSTIYELIEWAAANAFGGDLGVAYLGTQGDVWDAQRDMALAALGTVASLLVLALGGAARAPSAHE